MPAQILTRRQLTERLAALEEKYEALRVIVSGTIVRTGGSPSGGATAEKAPREAPPLKIKNHVEGEGP